MFSKFDDKLTIRNKEIFNKNKIYYCENKDYDKRTAIFLTLTGVVYSFYIISTPQKYLEASLFYVFLIYIVSMSFAGLYTSLSFLNKLKKYKLYISKPEYFDYIRDGKPYIEAYLVCEDNDEYIIKFDNESAIRIKKSLVDMIQHVIDETENTKQNNDKIKKKVNAIEAKKEVADSSEPTINNKTDKIVHMK